MPRPLRFAVVALLLPTLLLQSCGASSQGPIRTPSDVRVQRRSTNLDAHLRDGGFIAFNRWEYKKALKAVTGTGTRLDSNRQLVMRGTITIPIDSVAVFEAGSTRDMPPAMKATVIVATLGIIVIGLVIGLRALARGSPRQSWLALARMDHAVEPARLEPTRVLRDTVEDAEALASLRDPHRALTTGPGDRYVLRYALPDDPERTELFLESRGYYLEWMRERWFKSEDPGRLAKMMLNPRGALRELAPAYAREQVALEDWFWRSRYARP